MLKKLGIILGLVILAVGSWLLFEISSVRTRVSEAQSYMEDEQWREARHLLRQALRWSPSDAEANLMMAEALVRDDLLSTPGDVESGLKVVDEAIDYLSRIPDESSFASEAHVQIGRMEATLKLHPGTALEHLQKAVDLDPDNQEAYYWIWKVNELVGRPYTVVEDIWKAIELAPEDLRPILLRDWYMGEFFALTANASLEVQMGLRAPEVAPSNQTQAEQYITFINQEPDSTLGYVALARWFLIAGAPKDCLLQLDKAVQSADEPLKDPLLIATIIKALDDLGKIDEAAKYFDQWPGEKEGYEYWRAKGLIEHKFNRDLPAAIQAYKKAKTIWPGPVDWRTWNLLSNCLRENGQTDEAAATAQKSNEIERLMRADIQSTLRVNLGNLEDPQGLEDVIRFYRDLGLNREANAWQAIVDSLKSKAAKIGPEVP